MGSVFQRFLEAIRFDREAFVWMEFNDRATGDALILVLITTAISLVAQGTPLLGFVTEFNAVLGVIVNTMIFWLVYSAIVYAAVRYLFRGDGIYAVYLRIAGFAFPTLLLTIFTGWLIRYDPAAAFIGSLWFLAIVAYGTHYVADLPLTQAAGAAMAGYVGWFLIDLIRTNIF